MHAPEFGEALQGGLEVAEGFDLAEGRGIVGADEARSAEGAERGGHGFVGDGVEGGVVRGGAGGLGGIEVLEEELGEKVGLVQAVELGAEMIEARAERAEVGQGALFPVADQGEALLGGFGGLVGQVVGEGGVVDGEHEVAKGIAAGAAGEEGKFRGGRMGMRQIVEGEELEGLRGGVAGGLVTARRGAGFEQGVGEVRPGAGEVEPMVEGGFRRCGVGRVEREGLEDGDGGAVGIDGGGEGLRGGEAVEGVATIHPRGAEGVLGGRIRGEIRGAEERDRLVVGADGVGEGVGRGDFLEGVAAVQVREGEVAAQGGIARGNGAEERDGARVGLGGFGQRRGGGLGFEGLAAGEPGGGVRRKGGIGRRWHSGATVGNGGARSTCSADFFGRCGVERGLGAEAASGGRTSLSCSEGAGQGEDAASGRRGGAAPYARGRGVGRERRCAREWWETKLVLDGLRARPFNRGMVETLTVNLGERSYPIRFGPDLAAEVRGDVTRLLAAGRKVAVLTDVNLVAAQGAALRTMFGEVPVLAVEAGEGAKSLAGLGRVLDFLAEHKLDRGGVLFAAGGGVIGDLGGFAAATWLRGIEFVQVPTTLLAMVDSSVGGKTGINIAAGKNLVGAFHQPRGVYVATGLLATLPAREFAAGMAEVIKYGLLGDPELLEQLERRPLTVASAELAGVIRRCCALKARIVEADERETAKEGGRALLNLGHTFGHAVENAAGYGGYLHGEAVAIGLCAAARLSHKLGALTADEVARVDGVVAAHGLPVRLRAPLAYGELFAAMTRDKKVRAGGLRFVVLQRPGEAATQGDIAPALVEASFREVGAA